MQRFNQIKRGERKGYALFALAWLALALCAWIAWYDSGFDTLFTIALIALATYTPVCFFLLLRNARTQHYEPRKGFWYYRLPNYAILLMVYVAFLSCVLMLCLLFVSDQFDWELFWYGLAFTLCIPVGYHYYRYKVIRNIDEYIHWIDMLYSFGVLAPGEVIYAIYSNISNHAWSMVEEHDDDEIDWMQYEYEDADVPLHLLLVTEHELLICTQKPDQPLLFSTLPLAQINQLYVSSASYQKVGGEDEPTLNKQMITIGDGADQQYHFYFSSKRYTTFRLFVAQLLLCLDTAHMQPQPDLVPLMRTHPAYVPIEHFPALSTTDETYLPFIQMVR